jgi:voltage-gated potassium channel
MTASELSLLEDHVLVLGYGELTEPLLDELVATTDVVVVTPDSGTASALDERDVNVLTADPTDEDALLNARIDVASGVVVATDDDASDILAVLAAREANPEARIVAAASNHHYAGKLERVGADEVLSPSVIVGQRLSRSVLGDADGSPDGTGGTEESDAEDDGDDPS